MARPLAVVGISFLTVLAAALYLGQDTWLPLAAVLLGAVVFCLVIKRIRRHPAVIAVCLTGLAALLLLLLHTQLSLAPFDRFLGKTAVISGQICEEPYEQYGRFYYPVELSSITDQNGEEACHGKILFSAERELPADVFDKLATELHFSDSRSSHRLAKGYVLTGYLEADTPVTAAKTDEWSLYRMMIGCRRAIGEALHSLLPEEEASLTMAMLTGSKQGLSQETTERLRRAGISHIIAVSGFHVSLITTLAMGILYWLTRRRKQWAAVLCMIFVVLYMMLAGFSPSVTRAGIMQLLLLLGIVVFRTADGLNSLGLSVLLITLPNPYAAADVGLLLSFSATLGILLLMPRLSRYWKEQLQPKRIAATRRQKLFDWFRPLLRKIALSFSVSLSAYVFVLPVMILYFRKIYFWSVLVNMLVAPLLTVVILCTLLLLLAHFSVILSFLTMPLAFLTGLFTDCLTGFAGGAAALPLAEINVSQAFVPVWLFCSVAAAVVLAVLKAGRRAVKIYALAVSLTFLLSAGINGIINRTVTKLALLNTGNGVTLLLVHDGAASVLSCGGDTTGYAAVEEWLGANEVDHIVYLLVTDGKTRTSRYAEKMLMSLPVQSAEVYQKEETSEQLQGLLEQTEHLICRTADTGSYMTHLQNGTVISGVEKGSGYVYFENDSIRLLFCANGTDCKSLPSECRCCDVLVINGKVSNQQAITAKTRMVSGSVRGKLPEGQFSDLLSTLDGNIIIRLDPGEYRIRRESTWLN